MIEGRIGMFVEETITWIRRAHFVQGKLIKAICRELRVSRKTVRNVIRLEATEFHYERDEQSWTSPSSQQATMSNQRLLPKAWTRLLRKLQAAMAISGSAQAIQFLCAMSTGRLGRSRFILRQMELPMDVTASYRLRLLVRLSWACELKMKPR
jgi:hypothetical protein